ncbi:DUF2218 domain-containing protein [Allohahella marinimesophila]|uniref:DUF2218 domain-containing protein n=1 Tax=Allohahella marinimesophila TaxID=1054972 RepID=A0ABP7NXC4_9GAMM
MSVVATATVATTSAGLYLKKLCRHFQHKVTVDFGDTTGRIDFKVGTCDLKADSAALKLFCVSSNEEDLEDVKDTMKRHFDRFGEKDELVLGWDV